MSKTLQINDPEKTSARLLKSSAKNSYDPEIDIDWEAPLDETKPYIPLKRSSLYGTSLWDQLTEPQRLELTKHEFASIASNGLWFEMLLMQILLKDIYGKDPRSHYVHYALTEIADECRHSTMFGKACDRIGAPAYGPIPILHLGGRILPAILGGPAAPAAILVAEEILDRLQRDQMYDENVQPLVRMVNRIHVLEEARHVTFAREEVVRRVKACNPAQLAYHQYMTALISFCIVAALINPRVYAAVGLDPKHARRVALTNPHYRDTLHWSGEKIMAFLGEAGMIGKPGRRLWKKSGLLR